MKLVSFTPLTQKIEVEVLLSHDEMGLHVSYTIHDPSSAINFGATPFSPAAARANELWKKTCFEFFWAQSKTGPYFESNFAPSGAWNAYEFSDTRVDMKPVSLAQPPRVFTKGQFNVTLPVKPALALAAAVIALKDGTLTYWAPAHPPQKPDFHDRNFYFKLV